MTSKRKASGLKRVTTLGLMLAVFISSTMFVLAAPDSKALAGEIIISGSGEKSAVLLNGERTYSGRTFFSSGTIATPETSSAVVNLGKLGRINLAPNSNLSLSFAENQISGKLVSGQIKVFSNEGVSVNIETSDNAVTANQASVFTVNVQSGVTQAVAESGSISLLKSVLPNPQQTPDDDDDDDNSILIPVLVFAGIVGAAAVYTFTRDGDELQFIVSPTR